MTPRHKTTSRLEILQETRTQLLQAAAGEFARNGYDAANVNTIASKAGFSIGTVYNHFPTKRDLMLALIDETATKHVEFIIDRVKKENDPAQQVTSFYEAGFAFIEKHTEQAKAIFNTLNGPDEEFKVHLFQAYQPLFRLLSEDVIGPGVARGDFRQVEPVETSGLLMLLYLGAGSQFNRDGKFWLDHTRVADFVLHSLKTHGE